MDEIKFDTRKLTLIWEDVMMEHGGEETVNNFKNHYANYSIESLLEVASLLLETRTENHPCRYKIKTTTDYLPRDEYTVVFSQNEIDYKELLIALVTLMHLINIEDRPRLVVRLAQDLREMDREVSDRFAKDIAERVRWENK